MIGKVVRDKMALIRGDSLSAKSARSAIVLGGGTFAERGIRFVRNMILTRVLAPEHLGLMAVVMVVSLGCEAFTEVGVKQSVIQNIKGARAEYLNVAWWFQALRGFCVYLVAFLVAPLLCGFYFHDGGETLALYGKSQIVSIFRVAFLTILFNCLISPRAHVLEKEFRFGKSVFLIQGSAILATFITIVLVFYMRSVWAIVIGFVFEPVFRCFASYILCPFLPRLEIDRSSLSEIVKFARGMFGLPILSFIALQTDVMVLGKVVPMVLVGLYSMALQLSQFPKMLFAKVVGPILLPLFAEMQNDQRNLRAVALKMTKTVAFIGVPLVVFMSVCAGPILSVVYEPEYVDVAVPFALLSLCMLFSVQSVILAAIYLAIGKPQLHRRYVILLSLIIVGLIYPGIRLFGLIGSAGVLLLANVIALFAQVMWIRKLIGLYLREYIRCWLPGLCLTPIVFIPLMLLSVFKLEPVGLKLFVGGLSYLVAFMAFLASSLSSKRIGFFKVR